MSANYDFRLNRFEDTRTNPALGGGNIGTVAVGDVKFIAGATVADDLICIFLTSTGICRIIRRGSGTFAESGTLSTDYWNLTTANSGATNIGENSICFDKHPTTPADDLLIIHNTSTTAGNNSINIHRRTSGSTPFPGSATVDRVDRWNTASANIGGQNNTRAVTIAYDPTTRADDWLVIPHLGTSIDTQLIRRTSGSAPFPGAASIGADRIALSKANSSGGNTAYASSLFIRHPTDSTKDLIAFTSLTGNKIDLVPRGAGNFPGGSLGSGRFAVTTSTAAFNAPSRMEISYNPTRPDKDLLIVGDSVGIKILTRGTDDSVPFDNLLIEIPFATVGMSSMRGLAVGIESTRSNDILFAADFTQARVFYFNVWQYSAQPVSDPFFVDIIQAESPVLINSDDITIDAEVDIFRLDRTAETRIGPSGSNITWTRTTETDFVLDGGLIFSGATSGVTGNYSITMAASTTVTLGGNAIYDDTVSIPDTGTLILTGSTELGANFILSSGTTVEADDATGPYTLTIPYADPGLVLGTGIAIAAPEVEIAVTGLPNVANTILAVVNLTTSDVSYPAIAGGSATVPTDAATNYLLVADAPGYLSQRVVLSGATPAFEFSLPDYRAIYDAGVSRASDIGFNYSTFEVLIGDGTLSLSFADVFRTIEDYLATVNGVLFPNPPFPVVASGRNYLFFPYNTAAAEPNPVRIRPNPANTADPTLTDFVIILEGAIAEVFDIFDFTLAGGRTIRFQTEAVSASVAVSGGLSTEDRAVIDAIATRTQRVDGLLESRSPDPGDRFKAEAVEEVSGGSGGGGDATQAKQDAIKAVVDAILIDTAEIGAAGAGLTAIPTAAIDKYQGAIWFDDLAPTTGTVIGVNGTQSNPVSNPAHALALTESTGIRQINIVNRSQFVIENLTVKNLRFLGYNAPGQTLSVFSVLAINSTFLDCEFNNLTTYFLTTTSTLERVVFRGCTSRFGVGCTIRDISFWDSGVIVDNSAAAFVAVGNSGAYFNQCSVSLFCSRSNPTATQFAFYTLQDCYGSAAITAVTAAIGGITFTINGGAGTLTRHSSSTVAHTATLIGTLWTTGTGITATATLTPVVTSNLPSNFGLLSINGSGQVPSSNALTTLGTNAPTDWINAAAIATDAIGSAEISAAAVTKIQNGLSTLTSSQVNAEVDQVLSDVGLTSMVTERIDANISSRSEFDVTVDVVKTELDDIKGTGFDPDTDTLDKLAKGVRNTRKKLIEEP